MEEIKTRRRLLWELKSSWVFESSRDGTILFYPHGWGRAYLVPTEDKRREIEEFLTLWLTRLRCAIRVSRWISLPVAVILLATVFPPFCSKVWYVPGWHVLFRSALLIGALGCLLVIGSPPTLTFLAETAKADLEKAQLRRPITEFLRNNARRFDWRRLWMEEAMYNVMLLEGVWLLWPRGGTLMLPARVNPYFLAAGVVLIVLGGLMTLTKVWQIRTKLQS